MSGAGCTVRGAGFKVQRSVGNVQGQDPRCKGRGFNSHGARPVYLIITMIKRIRTRRLSIKTSLSLEVGLQHGGLGHTVALNPVFKSELDKRKLNSRSISLQFLHVTRRFPRD